MAERLTQRQGAILRVVVREYTRSGEPVGSKHVVELSNLRVSAATVRNEMARLEDLGYLVQPHTSAGRVPTDIAYRYVVDLLRAPRRLGEGLERALAEDLGDDSVDLEELLRRAGEAVSRHTHHAAAVLARRARSSTLRRIELIPMGSRAVMAVAIAENGRVEQRTIPLDRDIDPASVDLACETLNADLHGRELEGAIRELDRRADEQAPPLDALTLGIADCLNGLLDSQQHVFVGGAANLAGEGDLERDELRSVYELLERQTSVLELLTSALQDSVSVRIGSELENAGLRSMSVIVAPFGGGGTAGSIGIIGPMRMRYERVISTAHSMARMLEEALGQ
ncbi:MAG TPA: heat-inducible transcriptional repressor HrcA [Actinomycetota bacterium]